MTSDDRHASAPAVPPPAGPQRPSIARARQIGDLLATSGQTAVGPGGALIASGRLGDQVDLETGRQCAWQCTANVFEAVRAELGSLERVAEVVKLTVFVASAPGFIEQHLVADAATAYVQHVLGPDAGMHARSAIGVAELPTGSPVEVEALIRVR
ncbi:RidA family protein [Jiangella alba]|uniref:Enamine deaminase RidA, house cleaning of reactive enamine intermediates, YjgF/YER057c/UK114 family n=1 Tax=Jiangella alba TaxID=561176 RepID=A0A1H5IGI0_9ACTN|nr:RidA family protein [Jiangella alba]SEE39322.1 Enamine deaminase RidA, house cleaning of reactive enamine intermediates, YjgF/YER057c/UK114 family [Jiangella alba]